MNPTYALILLTLATILLALGLRGVRLDRDPRCRARRCRYPLRELLDAKQRANEPQWPITCPECGRVMESESRTRRGARKKLRPLIAIGILVALPALGLLGFEGYALWRSTRAVGAMPLWLLLRQAEKDTAATMWVHQKELFDRVASGAIDASEAPGVIERILRWQADHSVDYGYAGDALAEFAIRGQLTEADQTRAWRQASLFHLVLPETVEPGMPIPVTVVHRARSGIQSGLPMLSPTPWGSRFMRGITLDYQTVVRIVEIRIDGRPIALSQEHARLRALSHAAAKHRERLLGWPPSRGPWNEVVAPDHPPGAVVSVEIDLEWDLSDGGQHGLQPDPEQGGRSVSIDRWLAHRGVPTSGVVTIAAQTLITPSGSVVAETSADLEYERWLRAQIRSSMITVVRQPQGYHMVYVSPGRADHRAFPADPPALFGRVELVRGEWRIPISTLSDLPQSGGIVSGGFLPELQESMGHFVTENPTGWEVEITPTPLHTLRTTQRPRAWSGRTIREPIGVEIDLRCWTGEWSPMRYPAPAPVPD